jgi:hypothetical protein
MITHICAKAEKAAELIHGEFLKVKGQVIAPEPLVALVNQGKQPLGTLQLKLRLARATISNHEPKKTKKIEP